jgi:hypothetical protein
VSKESLDSSARIRVRTAEENLDAQRPDSSPGLLAAVVRGVVPQKDRVLLPPWRLGVQDLHKLLKEESDDVRIGVGVVQREPDPAISVEGGDHREPRRHRAEGHVAAAVFRRPCASDEARLVEPGLVDVDDALALTEDIKHLECVLLAEHATPIGVGPRLDFLGLDKAELALIPQHLSNEPVSDIKI